MRPTSCCQATKESPLNIVFCYPLLEEHIEQIQQVVPDANLINAGQEGVNEALPRPTSFAVTPRSRSIGSESSRLGD